MHMKLHVNCVPRQVEAFKHFDKDNSGFITKEEIIVGGPVVDSVD